MAYDRFKRALFDGRITPGAFLFQSDLTELLGSPLGAIREALTLLQAEGLVDIKPRSGISIAKPDFRSIRNSYQLRQLIECPAVRRFAETGDSSVIRSLESGQQALVQELRANEVTDERVREITAVDHAFHRRIVTHLDNPLVDRAYRQALEHIRLLRVGPVRGLTSPFLLRSIAEHLAIIRACAARDADAAEAALVVHCTQAMQRAMGL